MRTEEEWKVNLGTGNGRCWNSVVIFQGRSH